MVAAPRTAAGQIVAASRRRRSGADGHATSAVLVGRALSRFFESSWADRPGGAAAELAARLACHAAALHGAHLDVSSHAGAGTRVTMTFGG